MGAFRRHSLSVLVLTLAAAACAPRTIVLEDDFELSRRNATEVFNLLFDERNLVDAVSGRARVSMSAPGSSDRGIVEFTSNRTESLIAYRNNLGIEGGRIHTDADSITLYNRIERTAQRMPVTEADLLLQDGYMAVNVLAMINPDLRERSVRWVYEGTDAWLFVFADRSTAVIDKNTRQVRRLEIPVRNTSEYSTFLFDRFEQTDAYLFPRSIQILSEDKKSSIFVQVLSLTLNPLNPDFDLRIPSGIVIERL